MRHRDRAVLCSCFVVNSILSHGVSPYRCRALILVLKVKKGVGDMKSSGQAMAEAGR